jgi:hypothetical protein
VTVPVQPKIYHIVHVDRLPSIIDDKHLWCDGKIIKHVLPGTTIGMSHIKQRRRQERVTSHENLRVGDCVPFYFCPRSVMLYTISQGNHPDLHYRGGQDPIIHLEADLHTSVAWATQKNRRWAFSLSNAGASYSEYHSSLADLNKINWQAVDAQDWRPSSIKEGKQAEFLMEHSFPWHLIERVGVHSQPILQQVMNSLSTVSDRPRVEIIQAWYY